MFSELLWLSYSWVAFNPNSPCLHMKGYKHCPPNLLGKKPHQFYITSTASNWACEWGSLIPSSHDHICTTGMDSSLLSCFKCSHLHLDFLRVHLSMWQSHVEIGGYSIVYFDRIAAFEVPYCWTSVKGGAHMRFVDSLDIHASTRHVWTPPLMEVQ